MQRSITACSRAAFYFALQLLPQGHFSSHAQIYRIFVPELRRSLHIAKYRNEQKSARFHIVTYIIKANA
jgi:hypothetical protein